MSLVTADICREVGSIYNQLFDQKVHINNECKYLLYELETKRNDREKTQLDDSRQIMQRLTDETLPSIIRFSDEYLETLNIKIKETTDKAACIVEDSQNFSIDLSEDLKFLKEDWSSFQTWLEKEVENVDQAFAQDMSKLRESYTDIEGLSS